MASISNRSPWAVSARNQPNLYREFRYDRRAQAEAYAAELSGQGCKASVKQLENAYQVMARDKGYKTFCATFATLAEARVTQLNIEAERSRKIFRDYGAAFRFTLADLMQRYEREVCPRHKGGADEACRLRAIIRNETFVHKKLGEVTTEDIDDFITDRLTEVKPSTVDRDLDVLSQVINHAAAVWKIAASESPMIGVKRPRYFNERERRLKSGEELRLLDAARADENPFIEPIIVVALGTAMRRGEILSLRREHVDLEALRAWLPTTKNGRSRSVPLPPHVAAALASLPESEDGRFFPISANAFQIAFFRRVLPAAGIVDLHFQDLRHEATSRLAESGQYTLLELQLTTGHRDVRMLLRYTHLCATALAKKMGETLPPPAREYIWRGRKRVARLRPGDAAPVPHPDTAGFPVESANDPADAQTQRTVTSNAA
jgi:integrase